jgi:hypothetical protein
MKVGGSPLYYLPENVEMLENFYNYLGAKEKEAFLILKEKHALQDSELHPAIRVALRNLKDFAYPITIKINDSDVLFWRYFKINENEAKEKIRGILQEKKFSFYQPTPQKKEQTQQAPEIIEERRKEVEIKPKIEEQEKPIIKIREKKEKIREEFIFIKDIRDKLHEANIEVIEEKLTGKKELEAVIRTDSGVGKIMFYCVVKDKKTISDTDLAVYLQKAQGNRLPLLFLCDGKITPKAEKYLQEWKTLINVKKIKELI